MVNFDEVFDEVEPLKSCNFLQFSAMPKHKKTSINTAFTSIYRGLLIYAGEGT